MTIEERIKIIKEAIPQITDVQLRMCVNSILFVQHKGKIKISLRDNILKQYFPFINSVLKKIKKEKRK